MRKPLDFTTGKMKYLEKLIVRCWTFGITLSRSHLLPPASATSRKTAKSPPGLVSGCVAGLRCLSWAQAQKYGYLPLMGRCGFTSGGYSHGHISCQADTAPHYLFAEHSLRSRHTSELNAL